MSAEVETDPTEAGMLVLLDAVLDLTAKVDKLAADVAPALEAVTAMGPLAERLASGGGLMSLFRPG